MDEIKADDVVRDLLRAQTAYELERVAASNETLVEAAQRREQAMRQARNYGLSIRAVAEMTGMSHTRVIQILEGKTRRAETMGELEALSGEALADRLLALVLSNSLSREEMAAATRMTLAELNGAIEAHVNALALQRQERALAMVKRHMPPGWTS
jgi:hypothetical protein